MPHYLSFLALLALLPLAPAPYEWEWADQDDTELDPWTPCDKRQPNGEMLRGFCRLSCTARWSYAPDRMDCRMLPSQALLRRSHSRGLESFQTMSQESFSSVNSGNDPEDMAS